jgi:hypothetical protein
MEILSLTNRILWKDKKISSLSGANLSGANLSRANLSRANLSGANLSGANLSRANLFGANLFGTNLSDANLSRANLFGTNLSGTNLSGANLFRTNLSEANLSRANLSGANLFGTNLFGTNLSEANLSGANLFGANLSGAKIDSSTRLTQFQIPQEGSLTVFKKVSSGKLCKLLIPAHAKRTASVVGRKCRAEFAFVLEAPENSVSTYDHKTQYISGKYVYPDKYDPNPLVECSSGIHFFLTREEAESYH